MRKTLKLNSASRKSKARLNPIPIEEIATRKPIPPKVEKPPHTRAKNSLRYCSRRGSPLTYSERGKGRRHRSPDAMESESKFAGGRRGTSSWTLDRRCRNSEIVRWKFQAGRKIEGA